MANLLWLTVMQMSCQRNEDQPAGDSQFILTVHCSRLTLLNTAIFSLEIKTENKQKKKNW